MSEGNTSFAHKKLLKLVLNLSLQLIFVKYRQRRSEPLISWCNQLSGGAWCKSISLKELLLDYTGENLEKYHL